MDNGVDPLASRLHTLEGAMPGGELPSGMFDTHPNKQSRGRRVGIVAGLIAAMLISGAVGAAVHQVAFVSNGVTGVTGVFARNGGVLPCSPIAHMPPVEASKALAALGYVMTWEIEDLDQGSYWLSAEPPADGFIVDGVLEDGHQMLVLVKRGANVEPYTASGC